MVEWWDDENPVTYGTTEKKMGFLGLLKKRFNSFNNYF